MILKMALKCLIHGHPHFATVLDDLTMVNDQTYVQELTLEDAHKRPWYTNLLVPYSVAGATFAIMGPILKLPNCPYDFKNYFPVVH